MAARSGRSGFEVQGLREVVRDLKALGLEVEDLKAAFSKIADEGADRVQAHTPRRSGNLAGSARGNRAQSKAVVTVGRAALPYAGPINYGWPARNITGAAFMQKGDQEMRPVAIDRLEDEINHQIQRKGFA